MTKTVRSALSGHGILRLAGWREQEPEGRWNDPDSWDDSRYSSSGRFNLPFTYSGMILVVCVVLYLVKLIAPPDFVSDYLALNPATLAFRPWTIITHMFLHANINHLFVNMLVLFFFGTELERRVGENRFLQIFIVSGIIGAIGQMLITPAGSMMGASGALYGVLGCLALIAPEIKVLIFPIPIPLSIKASVFIFAFLDFAMMETPDNIAHMAHITGLLAGLAYGMMLKDRYRYR